ncbi:MAG: hypothetical protein H8E14_05760 [Candidatus Marinimicrobia bacterium]|nr:hypothetical protein [Candidatus Neomarinimicrobiota bacterium]
MYFLNKFGLLIISIIISSFISGQDKIITEAGIEHKGKIVKITDEHIYFIPENAITDVPQKIAIGKIQTIINEIVTPIDENEKRRQRELGIAAAKNDYHGITWGVRGFLTAAGTGVIGVVALGVYYDNEFGEDPIVPFIMGGIGGTATSIGGIALLRRVAYKSEVYVPSYYTQSITNEKALEFRKGYEDQMKKYRGKQVVKGGIAGTCTSLLAGGVLLFWLMIGG